MIKLSALCVVVCVYLATVDHHHHQVVEAVPSMVSCAKDYLVGLVKSKIIDKSQLVVAFNEALQRVQERYHQAEARGELAGKDEAEQSAFRYKLVIEEMRQLRTRFESGQIKMVDQEQDQPSAEDKLIDSCLSVSGDVDKKTTTGWSPDAPEEDDDDDIRELELWSELENLERQAMAEDEMGLSISPEVRDKLKLRTKLVLNDLLNNEIRQLALSVLSAYMMGGPMSGLVTAVSGSLKLKLVEYLMNGAMDILGSLMGRPIELKPVEAITPATYQPISADDLLANAKLAA